MAAITAAPPNLEKALKAQQRLAEKSPGNADVINDLGNLLSLAGRMPEAEAAYRRAVELAPAKPVPHYNLGLLLQRQGDREAALAQFFQVLKLDPENAWAHYQVGAIYEAQALRDKAIKAYSQAFTLDPDLAHSSVNPQVIDNRLVVEAMLKAYRSLAERPLAPRTYDDPSRIANLMIYSPQLQYLVQGPPEDELAGVEEEELEPKAPGKRRAGGRKAGGRAVFEGDDSAAVADAGDGPAEEASPETREDEPLRVLNSQNIERGGNHNQIGGESDSLPRSPSGYRAPPSRTYIAPGRSVPSDTGRSPRPTPSTRFRPSTGSTGRLELQLKPAPAEVLASAPAG